MIEETPQSEGATLGFDVSGDIGKADYDVLVPAVRSAVEQHGSIRLVLDLSAFRWEKVEAWGADLKFGHEFKHQIERLALVGQQSWGHLMTKIAEPFFANDVEWFERADDAWAWVRDGSGSTR